MNRYICCDCEKEFARHDFSDDIWSRFCCLTCVFTYFRARMRKPRRAE